MLVLPPEQCHALCSLGVGTPLSLCVGQVLGFVVILVGTSLYNEIIRSCLPTSMTSAGSRPDLEVSAMGWASWTHGSFVTSSQTPTA